MRTVMCLFNTCINRKEGIAHMAAERELDYREWLLRMAPWEKKRTHKNKLEKSKSKERFTAAFCWGQAVAYCRHICNAADIYTYKKKQYLPWKLKRAPLVTYPVRQHESRDHMRSWESIFSGFMLCVCGWTAVISIQRLAATRVFRCDGSKRSDCLFGNGNGGSWRG